MADLSLNSIGSLFSQGGVAAIAKRTKMKQEDVAKVLSQGLPVLVAGMRRNADDRAGEDALSRALADHRDADVSNPAAFLKGADLADGKKILGHVLGGDQSGVVEEISRATGVTKGKTTTILALAAPLLLTLLGNSSGSGGGLLGTLGGLLGLGASGSQSGFLGGLLGGGSNNNSSGSGGASLLGGLLGGSSGGLLGGLLGGGNQNSAPAGASNSAALTGGLLSSLLGGGNQGGDTIQIVDNAPQQQESQFSGLLDSFLSLFH